MRYQFLRFPGGKSKAFTLSYDDGKPADIKLSEIIAKYGVKCTFNLNGDVIRKDNGITKCIKVVFIWRLKKIFNNLDMEVNRF